MWGKFNKNGMDLETRKVGGRNSEYPSPPEMGLFGPKKGISKEKPLTYIEAKKAQA